MTSLSFGLFPTSCGQHGSTYPLFWALPWAWVGTSLWYKEPIIYLGWHCSVLFVCFLINGLKLWNRTVFRGVWKRDLCQMVVPVVQSPLVVCMMESKCGCCSYCVSFGLPPGWCKERTTSLSFVRHCSSEEPPRCIWWSHVSSLGWFQERQGCGQLGAEEHI